MPLLAFYWPGFSVILLGLSKVIGASEKLERKALVFLGMSFLPVSLNSWPVSSVQDLQILYSFKSFFFMKLLLRIPNFIDRVIVVREEVRLETEALNFQKSERPSVDFGPAVGRSVVLHKLDDPTSSRELLAGSRQFSSGGFIPLYRQDL